MVADMGSAIRKAKRIQERGPSIWDFLKVGGSETHGDD